MFFFLRVLRGFMCMISVGFWWRFSTVTARERERECVRRGDVRGWEELDTGRFVELAVFLSSLPPFSFPAF